MVIKNKGILDIIRTAYNTHRTARVMSKAFGAAVLADPAQAALDAFAGTQTVATAQAEEPMEEPDDAKPKSSGYLEAFAGHTGIGVDTLLSVPLPHGFSVFNRNIVGIPYGDDTSSLHVGELRYEVVDGLHLVVEGDTGTDNPPSAMAGAIYTNKFGDLFVFQTVQTGLDGGPTLFSLTDVGYGIPLTDGVSLDAYMENVFVHARDPISGATTSDTLKGRLGVKVDGVVYAGGCDLTFGTETELSLNCGGALKKGF
jgi:hypothetical protein